MNPRVPLVVILGATGCGKTKLSLELIQKFGGEIISSDSMQLYKGLDIITAKATPEERALAPHHIIDVLHPYETFTVLEFRNKALPIIEKLLAKNNLPIVVGGTNYYIESLLWKILIEDPGKARTPPPDIGEHMEPTLSNTEIYEMLLECDPVQAHRLHPNDKRKLLRSLEIFQQKGQKHSDIIKEQQLSEGGSSLGGALRFPNALILWLQCDQEVLHERLDSRVDLMIRQGLVDELLNFHKQYNKQRLEANGNPDYTKGIFQSIGFKEFHNYLMLNTSERVSDKGRSLLEDSINDLKRATRRYARKQNKWIINRFLSNIDRKVPPLYSLDATNINDWNKCVTAPAIDIIQSFVTNSISSYKPLEHQDKKTHPNSEAQSFWCDTCERIFIGDYQWNIHLKSNRHKRALRKKAKLND